MEQNANDPFASENSGTARFIGGGAADHSLDNGLPGGSSGLGNSSAGGTVSAAHEFQTMKPGLSGGLKTPGHSEIPHSELVKMLYYLEGELQARDVVIAALRNERVKQYISQLKTKRLQPNDPHAAIFRDKVALSGNLISRESSTQAAQAEMEVRQIIEQQMEQQYQMVNKQRATHLRMVNILTESLENNQRMLQELEEEKRKHEHDTAQGDDITYGLEMERTKLRQELEEERAQVKKLDKELKKLQETLEFERNRQKQIVLLLIAERKKIMMKYIEEGKRSEDLAQILAEEKQRSDTIAEGLEEESKKSLRMEEELEKQQAAFEQERKVLKASLAKEELRVKELEQELITLRAENETLKKHQQQLQQNAATLAGGSTAAKSRAFSAEDGCATSMVNIAKIVQPTATVSSVPVSGPTTGIARSLAPGQNLRAGVATAPTIAPLPQLAATPVSQQTSAIAAASAHTGGGENVIPTPLNLNPASTSSVVAGAAMAAAPPSPSPPKMQPTATIQRAPGGKYSALAAAAAAGHSLDQAPSPHPVPIAVPPVTVPPSGARGAPPPIPPNKPIVPPKREPSLSRLGSITGAAASVAAAASTATSNAKIN
ncbi:CTTNBP2 N-terminal-like protein isoform X2 [Stomoxys calcitrans]|uniref:Cortactin-binding protein-2 N-terminal domain-containing protein n=1 Tax=Stomoxys calcitrans TaxID=35570 RepID=A0A1I8Q0Q6_STOCA|nr:CTTNBP2 N-terminal-like protein isoform X2 [Stomoxys calcitrans]